MAVKVKTEVQEFNGKFVVSVNGCWFPGNYSSEKAAIYAATHLKDEEVREIRETKLRDEVNQCYLPIGMEHIEEYLNPN